MQLLARANLIFGLHVHVGIKDRALAFQIMNEALYFLPHLLALSTNSPFWLGRNTGLKSFRTKVFDRFPRTSIPEYFETPAEFDEFVRILVKTNCIDNGKKIWWDVRPHPFFETIEFRVCDVPMRLDETVTLAALFQAICVKLYKLRAAEPRLPPVPPGADPREQVAREPLRDRGQAHRLRQGDRGALPRARRGDARVRRRRRRRARLAPRGLRRVHWILENGTGADRQLAVYEATGGDLKKVVDYICEETSHGLPVEAPTPDRHPADGRPDPRTRSKLRDVD